MATQLVPPPAYTATEEPTAAGKTLLVDRELHGNIQSDFAKKFRFFLMIVSLYGMSMLVMIPCWNCLVLLKSWTYTQLLGTKAPLTFLLLLVALVCLLFATLTMFFRSTKSEVQTFQTIVMMGSAILTLLGVIFMLFGHEIAELARAAQKDVEHNCRFAQTTEPLFVESRVLYALRFHKECAIEPSVERCPGFVPSHAAQVLKSLEAQFKCSTFCQEVESPDEDFPRTLFSQANFRPACQTMLLRNLKYYVEDLGVQAYFQGCMLVLTAATIGLLKLVGFCLPQRRPVVPKASAVPPQADDYGSTRYIDNRGVLA